MSNYYAARERYRRHRNITREQLESDALHVFRRRVDVVSIDDDILRIARRDWYECPGRRVGWDWERDIMEPLRRTSARPLDLAILVNGQLCAMAAARVSHKKRWLSLTHIEGCPVEHPLAGVVLPLVVNGLYIYRAVISTEKTVKSLGIRVLNPLDKAVHCYQHHGYTLSTNSKWLRSIVIEPPIKDGMDHERDDEPQASSSTPAYDGAGSSGRT